MESMASAIKGKKCVKSEAVTCGYRPTSSTINSTANVAPVEKVSTLKRAMECARRSILGLPVRAPHACKTGAARANPTKSSAQNMWMSIVRSEEHTSELQSRQYLV